MDNGNLPATIDVKDLTLSRPPDQVLVEAKKAADALRDVIANKPKPVMFNGEQYLEFEDWQTVGRFYGITAKVVKTQALTVNGIAGFEAEAVALHVATGQEISRAEAMCMQDEPNWRNKPLFQLRSMSQTRACAKALRNVLAWVVVLAGYRPTPAEEMDGVTAAPAAPRPSPQPQNGNGPTIPYGKHKGKQLDDPTVPMDYLLWFIDALDKDMKDPAKAKFKAKAEAMWKAVDAELKRRENGPKSAIASQDEFNEAMSREMDLQLQAEKEQ